MIKVVELFAGVGGFRVGLERTSDIYNIVWSNQWEPSTKTQHASYIYIKNFGEKNHSNVDIGKVKSKDIPNHDLLVGGFPCFVAGTKILTKTGYKNIEDVQIGDYVLTHKNRFKKVIETMNKKSDKILNIKIKYRRVISCTDNHPFYCLEKYKDGSFSDSPKWINAKDIDPNIHFVGVNNHDFHFWDYDFVSFLYSSYSFNNKFWIPFDSIEEENENNLVYNFGVEEDESYTVEDIIVHNCQSYSVASTNAEGLAGGKGILWWDIYRITKDKKPKYLFLENVDRLLKSPSSQRGKDFAIILASLNNLGYSVEWMVINAAEYGFPQRRKRTFIFASLNNTKTAKELTGSSKNIINNKMLLTKAFNIKEIYSDGIITGKLSDDLVEITETFNKETPKKNAFLDVGFMKNGVYFSSKYEADYYGEYSYLKDVLIDEKDVSEEFYISDEEYKRWAYLKGSKKFERVDKKTGHCYIYSEGKMGFPDDINKPSRTIITGEGGKAASRFKHVIKVNEKYRRLTPIELERLSMFDDNHTEGVSNSKRAFLIGNALVIGIVEQFALELMQYDE